MGPALMGMISQVTGKTNYGVLSVILLFIIGGAVLFMVPKEEKELV